MTNGAPALAEPNTPFDSLRTIGRPSLAEEYPSAAIGTSLPRAASADDATAEHDGICGDELDGQLRRAEPRKVLCDACRAPATMRVRCHSEWISSFMCQREGEALIEHLKRVGLEFTVDPVNASDEGWLSSPTIRSATRS